MPRRPDVGWQHGTMIGEKRHHVQCNYCHRIMIGGITRFKKHLASKKGEIKGCDAVPKDVRDMIRRQLATAKPKKGSEKKEEGAIVGSSMAPSLGDHAFDPNGSDILMNARKDLLTIDHTGVQDNLRHIRETKDLKATNMTRCASMGCSLRLEIGLRIPECLGWRIIAGEI
ncbi:hypothetical protein KSP39_PZI002895 [Platanthera zijinensis]|uniref:BED-type domain-containing protein n=1 Tax=Platanthera zijinensis TaxID=2320716 RepID=A0AAP0BYC5_9ASPA